MDGLEATRRMECCRPPTVLVSTSCGLHLLEARGVVLAQHEATSVVWDVREGRLLGIVARILLVDQMARALVAA